MEEPKQTTRADIEAMTDEQLLQEWDLIVMALEMRLGENVSYKMSLQLFWLSITVSGEISKRGLDDRAKKINT